MPTNNSVDLGQALSALRGVLASSWEESKDEAVRFRVSEVKLTVQTIVSREGGVGAKIRWLLVEAGADAKTSSESTQTLELTLQPQVHVAGALPGPLDVAGTQSEPGD